jgi:hypothetical protein
MGTKPLISGSVNSTVLPPTTFIPLRHLAFMAAFLAIPFWGCVGMNAYYKEPERPKSELAVIHRSYGHGSMLALLGLLPFPSIRHHVTVVRIDGKKVLTKEKRILALPGQHSVDISYFRHPPVDLCGFAGCIFKHEKSFRLNFGTEAGHEYRIAADWRDERDWVWVEDVTANEVIAGEMPPTPPPKSSGKKSIYAGGGMSYISHGKDFDVDRTSGFRFLAGMGFTERWATEVSVAGTSNRTHRISKEGEEEELKTRHRVFSVDERYRFRPSKATRPFILFGLGIHQVVFDGPSTKESTYCYPEFIFPEHCVTTPASNGNFSGWGVGLDLGLGVDQYITRWFSIGTELMYRPMRFTNMDINGDTLSVSVYAVLHGYPKASREGVQSGSP